MSKSKLQARMRALSFDEKIRILERLRDRSLAIATAGLRRNGLKVDKSSVEVQKGES
jgi:hypothetical protein